MRQPITTPDILPKSIHGGHTIGSNGIGDPETTITRFGSADGVFRISLPESAPSGIFAEFFPYQDIEIIDFYIVRNATAGDTPTVRLRKSNRDGSGATTISSVALTNAPGAIDRATALASRNVEGSDGQRIFIDANAAVAIAGGATAYVRFMNRAPD